jgi:putative peptidoglycan lipid II flippase
VACGTLAVSDVSGLPQVSSKLARSAGVIGIATMTSRLLGVAREAVLAWTFGAGFSMDAFNVAFKIPNLLRDLFAEGAMTAAFLPTFTRTLSTQGRDAAWRLGSLVINSLLLVTGVLVVIGIVFAFPITSAIAPRFADSPGKLELTTSLTRIMLPFLTTVAVAVAMMGMLNALHRFFIPALSPAMFNVATILAAVALTPVLEGLGVPGVMSLAIGTLIGGLGQIALQWPALRGLGFRYHAVLDFKNPELREVLRLMVPGTLGLAAVQINVLVNTYLATSQPEGAVSWLNYAFRLMYLPIGLFGVSIATAALPDISRQAVTDDLAAIRRTVSSGLRLMLMLNVPATVGLMVLAEPIVSLLLERGQFRPFDSLQTATALMFYAPGLLGYSAVKIASPTFYSLRDSRTPVIVSMVSVAANLTMNLSLVRVMGFRGLALGTSLAAMINAGALLWLLSRRLRGLERGRIAIAFAKIAIASLVMGAAVHCASAWMQTVFPGRELHSKLLQVFGAISIGVLVLALMAKILRISEFNEALSRVSRRLTASRRP